MLVIPTYVEKSEIDGLGLYAGKDIEAGEVIWFFDPSNDQVIPATQFDKMISVLDTEQQDRFKRWSYRRGDDYVLCADNTKFANHSETPNCQALRLYDVTLKAISKGEEITYNYRQIDDVLNQREGALYEQGEEVGETVGTT